MDSDEAHLFTDIFHRHRHAVHAYLLGRVANAESARDLLQETFLRVWRRLAEVRRLDVDRQRAWIFIVARNLTIDEYRSDATRQATCAAIEQQPRPRGIGPPEQVELRDRLAVLQNAIRALPEEQRVILSMATVGEMTSKQIGDALGQPAGTIRYKLSRARGRLAAALALDLEDVSG